MTVVPLFVLNGAGHLRFHVGPARVMLLVIRCLNGGHWYVYKNSPTIPKCESTGRTPAAYGDALLDGGLFWTHSACAKIFRAHPAMDENTCSS
jgi:hypothetical protein